MDPTRAFDPSKMKAAAAEYSSSESEEEDDDYLMPSTNPNADEFADYNPRKRRRTGRDAKESAALGIFGSESEDDRPGQRWKKKTLRNKGMSFVSANDAKKGNENNATAEEEDDDEEPERPSFFRMNGGNDIEDEEDEEDEDATPGIGLGYGASAGLGRGRESPPDQDKYQAPKRSFKFGGAGQPLGMGFTPSSTNEPVLKVNDDAPSRPQKAMPSAFSSKGGKTKVNPKSFGARMMAKMGFVEGTGLGKEGQGRNVVIEANLRPQKVGLGAVKEKTDLERQEEKRQARLRGEVVVDSDEEEKKKKKERARKARAGGLKSGSGSAASTPRRQKPKYATIEEIKKAAPGLDIPAAFTPILDLTGPGKKMLTSSSGLMTPTAGMTEEDGDPQSKKLVLRAQNDFMAILEEWQGLQERKAFAELQLHQEAQELEELEKAVESHQTTAAIFDELTHLEDEDEVLISGGDHTKQRWDRVISLLRKADQSMSDLTIREVKDEMASIAVAAIQPILKDMVEDWNPLQDARAQYAHDLGSIQELLGFNKSAPLPQMRSSATPYESMMYKLWLPHVSRAVREWNVRDAEPLVAVFEAWHSVLPGFLKTQLLEQDIIRRLDEAIAKWEPKRKKQHNLPHLWLFPWFQYLPEHHLDPKASTGLVADVKRKFRQLIDVWEFNRGVIPGLREWRDILRTDRTDQWTPLVLNHILPNMARYIRKNFDVNPSDQQTDVLTAVLDWLDPVSPTMIAEVIAAEVFPKWHEILYQWLVMETVNYEDVAQWCEWWHDEALAGIDDIPSIASEFEKGLHTIEHALELFDLNQDASLALPPPEHSRGTAPQKATKTNGHHHHKREPYREKKHHASPFGPTKKELERSFRHIVEDWCQENDLQFMPERRKVHSEGPLYRITARGDGKGGALTYFKGDKLCVETKNGVEEFTGEPGSHDWDRLMTYAL
ncbi:GC-rich sequence DNA-binding factor-like protein-domain-containing protein [Diaporthe sp. PMI_573]|nr:GC-rich sequence DNA-binding factor-like protein-domain-containing protein [Diaporthaceae sp. PMI_573]